MSSCLSANAIHCYQLSVKHIHTQQGFIIHLRKKEKILGKKKSFNNKKKRISLTCLHLPIHAPVFHLICGYNSQSLFTVVDWMSSFVDIGRRMVRSKVRVMDEGEEDRRAMMQRQRRHLMAAVRVDFYCMDDIVHSIVDLAVVLDKLAGMPPVMSLSMQMKH